MEKTNVNIKKNQVIQNVSPSNKKQENQEQLPLKDSFAKDKEHNVSNGNNEYSKGNSSKSLEKLPGQVNEETISRKSPEKMNIENTTMEHQNLESSQKSAFSQENKEFLELLNKRSFQSFQEGSRIPENELNDEESQTGSKNFLTEN